ncbi:MAG: glycosyltransferase family 39 protein [Candidatus Eremiobacteraeota bacterium]|nr:glycosyltransferase family 39 protein [Candidatus Eremiobacteraeota bacterium]
MARVVAPSSHRRYVTLVWAIVIATTLLRLVVATRLPLSGDEAYYWEWSRRLAFGYFDHPPMVAWLIALFSLGIKSTLLIRLPFVLCGLGCAVMLHAFVARATGDQRAGANAALLLSLTPFAIITFTTASPDGPFLFFWSVSLYIALRSIDPPGPQWRPALALSVAGATLSRVLGGLLAVGIAYALAASAKRGPPVQAGGMQTTRYALPALFLFSAAMAPYLIWNALHDWAPLRFAVFGRHDATFHGGNIIGLIGLYVVALTPGVFIAAVVALARLVRRTSSAELVLFSTAAPLLLVCLVLALRERVEFYWADGAFVSLVAALGLYSATWLRGARFALVVAPAALVAGLLLVIAALPLESYQFAQRAFGVHLSHAGPFEIWAFEPGAHEVSREARRTGAWIMTDGYGLSSVLDFYGGIAPVVIGYDQQGREARTWVRGDVPSTAIFFDKEPLDTRPDFARQLKRACANVKDDGQRSYYVNGVLARTFYLTRCNGLTRSGFSSLRWGDAPP